jgi:hypothetical protein
VATKNRVFRLTDKDMENIKTIGEQLVKEGTFGIESPNGDINMTAVLRYLVHEELKRRKSDTKEEDEK